MFIWRGIDFCSDYKILNLRKERKSRLIGSVQDSVSTQIDTVILLPLASLIFWIFTDIARLKSDISNTVG